MVADKAAGARLVTSAAVVGPDGGDFSTPVVGLGEASPPVVATDWSDCKPSRVFLKSELSCDKVGRRPDVAAARLWAVSAANVLVVPFVEAVVAATVPAGVAGLAETVPTGLAAEETRL